MKVKSWKVCTLKFRIKEINTEYKKYYKKYYKKINKTEKQFIV